MKKLLRATFLTAIMFIGFSSLAMAQSAAFDYKAEVGGSTGLSFTRQTLTPEGGTGVNSDNTSIAATILYYAAPRVGVGLTTSFTKLSLGIPDSSDTISLSTWAVGPSVKFRLPVGENAAVYVAGGGGIARNDLTGGGEASAQGVTDGKFFTGGGGVNFFIGNNISLNAGVQYQQTNLSQESSNADASGFVGALGFSMYFGE